MNAALNLLEQLSLRLTIFKIKVDFFGVQVLPGKPESVEESMVLG